MSDTDPSPPFAIFRARDAMDYKDTNLMVPQPMTETELTLGTRLSEAGVLEGASTKVLYARPGMSLSYAWFKSGFPLPRHSHDADCLYFIVAGSLRLGTEELGPGDGFFLGSGVPYTYVPGPRGVEVLEFRTADAFDIKLFANNAAFWTKALAGMAAAHERWPGETPPSGMRVG